MKISHRNVAYSDIPRLVQEGVIKVGTKVKACEDQKKYPNLNSDLLGPTIDEITTIGKFGFETSHRTFAYDEISFLDILCDEGEEETKKCHVEIPTINEDGTEKDRDYWHMCLEPRPCPYHDKDMEIGAKECTCDPKPLSFDEPLTKEAVGRVIKNAVGDRRTILEVGESRKTFLVSLIGLHEESNSFWWTIQQAKNGGWHFESSPEEITIEEAEKLTGKKIKR